MTRTYIDKGDFLSNANILLRRFSKCSIDVKCYLIKMYCSNLYCSSFWYDSSKMKCL